MNILPKYSEKRFDPLLTFSWLYLWLPVLLFLTTWCRPELGIPAALLATGAVGWLCLRAAPASDSQVAMSWRVWLGLAVLSLVWAWLSGMGGFVGQHSDYDKHNLIFRDLMTHAWPVHYQNPARQDPFLCYYVAYYLPPTALVRGLGLTTDWIDGLSFGWGWLGIWLVLAWVVRLSGRWGFWVAALLLLLSGLEVPLRLGWAWLVEFDGNWSAFRSAWARNALFVYTRYQPPRFFFADHLWAHSLDATPLVTQLQATPQHTLAGWLGAALWLHGRRLGWGLGHWGMLLAPTLLWSPFVTVGLGACVLAGELTRPGSLLACLRRITRSDGVLMGVAGLTTALLGLYLAAHEPVAQAGLLPLSWKQPSDAVLFVAYLGLQYGLPLWLLTSAARSQPTLTGWTQIARLSAVVISTLALFHLGLLNDFQVRAIIPAQFAFLLALANGLVTTLARSVQSAGLPQRNPWARWALLIWGALALTGPTRWTAYLVWAWVLHPGPHRLVNTQSDISRFLEDGTGLPRLDFAAQYLGRRDSWYWTWASPGVKSPSGSINQTDKNRGYKEHEHSADVQRKPD